MKDIKNKIINWLVKRSRREYSTAYKFTAVIGSALFFAVLTPCLLIFVARFFECTISIDWYSVLSYAIVILSLPMAFFFIIWALIVQVKNGLGTPVHSLPTKKLVITGPYKLCRNPMQFGGMLWYLGFGTLLASPAVGIFCALCEFTFGTLYHKLIEEKELEIRFGNAYLEYKKYIPFLIPRIF